jgi:hypothetical protein
MSRDSWRGSTTEPQKFDGVPVATTTTVTRGQEFDGVLVATTTTEVLGVKNLMGCRLPPPQQRY